MVIGIFVLATVLVLVDLWVLHSGLAIGFGGGIYLGALVSELVRILRLRHVWPAIDPVINWKMVDELLEDKDPEGAERVDQ